MENSIRTFSGTTFDYLVMNPDSILIEDIANALARIPRWGGHSYIPYSVAQHCCWCHDRLIDEPEKSFEALMHDSPEAYLGDCPKPLKSLLPDYQKIEDRLSHILAKKFDYPYPHSSIIKDVDKLALNFEWYNVKLESKIECWSYERAAQEFLNRYYMYVAPNVTQKQK